MLEIRKTSDPEIKKTVEKALKSNDNYCPCKISRTSDTKCMCKEFRDKQSSGPCHCGLYEKVIVD